MPSIKFPVMVVLLSAVVAPFLFGSSPAHAHGWQVGNVTVTNIGDTGATVNVTVTNIGASQTGRVYGQIRTAGSPAGQWGSTGGPNPAVCTGGSCFRSDTVSSSDGSTQSVQLDFTGLTEDTAYEVRLSTYSTITGWSGHHLATGSFTTTGSPQFDADTADRDLPNNTTTGGNVGMPVTATDSQDATLTYSLSGSDASKFEIGSSTGQITLASGVTIGNVGTTYSVTVTATDSDNNTDTINVTITVTGPNTAPAFASTSVSRSVAENSGEGTNVGEPVAATDVNNDSLTYTLGGTDASKYDIDGDSGQITVGSGTDLDYEADPSDSVTVTATDPYGASDTAIVSITITDVNVAGDLRAPPNVQVRRSPDNMSVTVSWSAQEEGADNYTVQRQELTQQPSSSFFANTLTVSSGLSGSTLSYVDDSILSSRTYEYRVAAIKDEVVGEYSDWFRTTPYETTYGDAPENLRSKDGTERDGRREYWLQWDEVDGSSDYELEVSVASPATGTKALRQDIIVTDPTYFYTAYSRAEFRVRGRKQDADLCGSGALDRCYTGWTAWLPVAYTAPVRVDLPMELMTPVAPDAKTMEMRDTLEGVVDLGTGQTGFTVAAGGVLDFMVLAGSVTVAVAAFAAARRRNLGAPGLGVAFSQFNMCLWLGYIMVGSPIEWPIIASIVLFVGGALSGLRVLGVLGGR